MTDIVSVPVFSFFGGEIPTLGSSIDVEFTDGPILWDDDSAMLWDDGTPILWSHLTAINPDVVYLFETPRFVYTGEAD